MPIEAVDTLDKPSILGSPRTDTWGSCSLVLQFLARLRDERHIANCARFRDVDLKSHTALAKSRPFFSYVATWVLHGRTRFVSSAFWRCGRVRFRV